jgi:lipoprotein-anchoring transpeptidase ErfK/SrfK
VQTLKTAIVVLLMMTVIYGCYVSLTTSPEPLPEHIVNLIDESGSFDDLGIDEGLPGSFADFGTESGEPTDDVAAMGPAQLSFTDSTNTGVAPTDSSSGTPAAMASFSDREPTARQLPKPDDSSTAVPTDLGGDYPSTQVAASNLPDPRSIDSLPPSGWKPDAKPNGDSIAMPGQTPKPATESSDANVGLANAIRTADRQYAADQPAEALATLSLFYNTPGLTEAERAAMLNRLDPLAAVVIYSRRHLLEQPHRVGQAETLMEIASRYELPWQLLANINSIEDPITVLPGTELKVVRGPFRAEVDLQRNELTIFLGDLYAGRFPIAVGTTPAPEEGTFTVQDKQSAQTFYDKDGTPIPPDDPRNPYGNVWLDLGKQLCIHGSPDKSEPSTAGCISLRGADANDLYAILSQGSTVTIRR